MSVDLVRRVGGGEGEGVEGVVDAGGVEGRVGFRGGRGGLVVEGGEVEPFGLFDGRFAILGRGAGVFFLGGEDGVLFRLFACGFFFLGLGFLSVCLWSDDIAG